MVCPRITTPALILTLGLLGCVQDSARRPVAPAPAAAASSLLAPAKGASGPMWASAETVLAQCDAAALKTERTVEAFKNSAPVRSEADLAPLNEVLFLTGRVRTTAELIAAVHPDHAERGSAEVCERAMHRLKSEILLDRSLYDILVAIDTATMDPGAQRFVAKVLREAQRAGVNRDATTRQRLRRLDAWMTQLRQDFSRRIRESQAWIEVSAAALEGLPRDFVDAKLQEFGDPVILTTEYTDFFVVQSYADDAAVRRALYRAFLNRAYPANATDLMALLKARAEYASLLGFDSWTAYMADDKMIGSAKAIDAFIRNLSATVRPKAEADLALLLKRKKKDDPRAERVEVWDRFYYVQKLRKEKFGVDASELRKYFEYERVRDGVMDVFGSLFGLSFRRDEDTPVWHPSVTAWEAYEGDRRVGRFFLDMHPRPDKYEHAAMFSMGIERADGLLPVAALVCNFPPPASAPGPKLMDHAQVRTFFREFGHIVHHLLATRSPWANQAGITVELDFVEAPAQLFEEWAWAPQVLARFARHHETNAPVPEALVANLRKSDELGRGVDLMRQVHYTALSAYLHQVDPSTLDLQAFHEKMIAEYSPYPYPERTHGYASFGHLDVYSSMYYTYQWSLGLAKDILTRFEKTGLLDRATARAYADAVLRPGGSKPAAELVRGFLGRAPNLEAYQRWIAGH